MRLRLALPLLAFVLLIAPPGSAWALETKELREDIIAGLERFAGPLTSLPMTYDEVRVWPDGQAHRVEISGLASQPGDLGLWADLGTLAFSVQEAGEGLYRVSDVQVPASVPIYDDEGNQFALLASELARFQGIWMGALSNFLDMDLLVTDVRFGLTDGSFVLSLDRVGGVSRAEEDGAGRTDQQAKVRATALHAEMPGEGVFDIAEIEGETSVRGINLEAYAQLTREYEALARREGGPSDADLAALVQRMSALDILPRSFAERLSVSDVVVRDGAGQTQFRLERGEMDFAGDGFDQALAELRFGLKHEDLVLGETLSAQAGSMSALAPRNLGLVLAVERLPVERLWQSLLRTLAFAMMQSGQEGQSPGAMDQLVLFMLLGETLPALTEAGTQIKLPHLVIESEAATLRAEGAFDVNPAAPQGVTGAMEMAILGLDRVIALLEAEANAGNQEAIGALSTANWLKSKARRENDSDGNPVDHFRLQITEDGRTLLNGQPFSPPAGAQ